MGSRSNMSPWRTANAIQLRAHCDDASGAGGRDGERARRSVGLRSESGRGRMHPEGGRTRSDLVRGTGDVGFRPGPGDHLDADVSACSAEQAMPPVRAVTMTTRARVPPARTGRDWRATADE